VTIDRPLPSGCDAPLTAEDFRRLTGVSRETLARLERHAALLAKWQKRINLVGRESLRDLWRRHMLDSAQLVPLLPERTRSVADIGSGAGFPGLVLAIMGVPEVHLIEADARKCAFLGEAVRVTETAASVRIHRGRVEDLDPWPVDVVVARAVAPLTRLLDYAEPFLRGGTVGLFPKGAGVEEELTRSRETWTMTVERFPSVSDPSGTILRLGNITRASGPE
jgi:16S rRNA (guanine527-N7)-methyltransferase